MLQVSYLSLQKHTGLTEFVVKPPSFTFTYTTIYLGSSDTR